MFKGAIIPFLYKLEAKEKGTLPNIYCEASIILISRPDEIFVRKVNYKVVCLLNIDSEIINKILTD